MACVAKTTDYLFIFLSQKKMQWVFFELFFWNGLLLFLNRVKNTNQNAKCFMDNKILANMIRKKFYEENMSAEYELQCFLLNVNWFFFNTFNIFAFNVKEFH